MASVTYDEATHRYLVDGVPVLSVTQALKSVGQGVDYSSVPLYALEHARARGVWVDAACDADDDEALDEDKMVDEAWPYVRAWRLFKAEEDFVPALQQPILWHPDLRYCGRPDVIGWWRGYLTVVDRKATEGELHDRPLKSGPNKGRTKYGTGSGYALQVAAYAMDGIVVAHAETLEPLGDAQRLVVQLRRDGSFSVYDCAAEEEKAGRDDYAAWLAVLALARWRNGR